MKRELGYVDPRPVAFYDAANPRGADTDFYLTLAEELRARTVVDLGCGTGVLTCALARPGRTVIGVDPSPAMLVVAGGKPIQENRHDRDLAVGRSVHCHQS